MKCGKEWNEKGNAHSIPLPKQCTFLTIKERNEIHYISFAIPCTKQPIRVCDPLGSPLKCRKTRSLCLKACGKIHKSTSPGEVSASAKKGSWLGKVMIMWDFFCVSSFSNNNMFVSLPQIMYAIFSSDNQLIIAAMSLNFNTVYQKAFGTDKFHHQLQSVS